MPDISKILVVPMVYHQGACLQLQAWLTSVRSAGASVVDGAQEYGIDVSRNLNCKMFMEFFVPRGFEYLVMVDSDIVPTPESNAIMHEDGDLLFNGYTGRGVTRGHYGHADFGAGFMRVSASALAKIPKPYFKFLTSPDHTEKFKCECGYFKDKAIEAGVMPRMVGVAGHRTSIVMIPQPESTSGWGILTDPNYSPRYEAPKPKEDVRELVKEAQAEATVERMHQRGDFAGSYGDPLCSTFYRGGCMKWIEGEWKFVPHLDAPPLIQDDVADDNLPKGKHAVSD